MLTALFANIAYTQEADPFEHYFQSVIYIVFTLLEKYTVCEMHTYSGRIDCRVQTNNYIYLFEFKRDDSADAALAQIDSKDYALPFIADSRKLYKIGVSFDSSTRKLVGWKVGEQGDRTERTVPMFCWRPGKQGDRTERTVPLFCLPCFALKRV